MRDCRGCREGEARGESLQENPRHYRLYGRGRQRPHEGNGSGELQAHQGGSEADCSRGTGTYRK